eukprot:6480011-Amphidinium_carterae.1
MLHPRPYEICFCRPASSLCRLDIFLSGTTVVTVLVVIVKTCCCSTRSGRHEDLHVLGTVALCCQHSSEEASLSEIVQEPTHNTKCCVYNYVFVRFEESHRPQSGPDSPDTPSGEPGRKSPRSRSNAIPTEFPNQLCNCHFMH